MSEELVECPPQCGGCACHLVAPCGHCEDGHGQMKEVPAPSPLPQDGWVEKKAHRIAEGHYFDGESERWRAKLNIKAALTEAVERGRKEERLQMSVECGVIPQAAIDKALDEALLREAFEKLSEKEIGSDALLSKLKARLSPDGRAS